MAGFSYKCLQHIPYCSRLVLRNLMYKKGKFRISMKKKLRLTKNARIILIVVLSLILSFSIYKIVSFIIDYHNNDNDSKEIKEQVINKPSHTEETENKDEDENIDFSKLLEINSDIKGWIKYNKISYPILQTNDNDYYLNYSFKKKKSQLGSIFMDYRNVSLDDRNVVIYGHNAIHGKMFGTLAYLLKKDFYNKNKEIEITDINDNKIKYQIFSYYVIEEENYYITTSFNSDEEYQNFLNTIKGRSKRKIDIDVSATDRILTLSTCYGSGNTTKRIVVHAKRVN